MRIKSDFKQTAATLSLMSLLWLLYTLIIPSLSHAAIFFDTDFGTCSTGTEADFPCEGWNDFDGAFPGHLEVSTSLAFSGTKAVKATYDNINGSSQTPSIYNSGPFDGGQGTDHAFFRFAYRESAGFLIGSNGITKIMKVKSDIGYPDFYLVNQGGAYAIHVENPYGYDGSVMVISTGVPISTTSWDQPEIEWQLNTPGQANGLLRVWINGTLRAERLNTAWRGPTLTSKCRNGTSTVTCPSNANIRTFQIYIQSGVGTSYYDRTAMGDTRIGPIQSRSADSTPPASPRDFQAR
jgi:hypothetical protein